MKLDILDDINVPVYLSVLHKVEYRTRSVMKLSPLIFPESITLSIITR